MGFWKTSKKIAGHIVDVRVDKWMGFDFLKKTGKNIYRSANDLFTPEQATRNETFEQALTRLNVSEAELQKRYHTFSKLCFFFILAAIGIFSYSIYIAIQNNLMGFFIGLALTVFSLSQAFRYHFWMFQIKHRKLGCSLRDWLNSKPEQTEKSVSQKEE